MMDGRNYFEAALDDFERYSARRNTPTPGSVTNRQHMQDYAIKAGLGMMFYMVEKLEQIERNTRRSDGYNDRIGL